MRTPNSWVRWTTSTATIPYTPTAASPSASTANAPASAGQQSRTGQRRGPELGNRGALRHQQTRVDLAGRRADLAQDRPGITVRADGQVGRAQPGLLVWAKRDVDGERWLLQLTVAGVSRNPDHVEPGPVGCEAAELDPLADRIRPAPRAAVRGADSRSPPASSRSRSARVEPPAALERNPQRLEVPGRDDLEVERRVGRSARASWPSSTKVTSQPPGPVNGLRITGVAPGRPARRRPGGPAPRTPRDGGRACRRPRRAARS